MQLGNDYKIESDNLNVTLYQRRIVLEEHMGKKSKRAGEETWDVLGYYSSVQNALDGAIHHGIQATGLVDLKTVVAKQNELERLIRNLRIPPQNNGTQQQTPSRSKDDKSIIPEKVTA